MFQCEREGNQREREAGFAASVVGGLDRVIVIVSSGAHEGAPVNSRIGDGVVEDP